MGEKELSKLGKKLRDDPTLRALFVQDVDAAARVAGITLDKEDHKILRELGVHDMDEAELLTRVSAVSM